MGSGLLNKINSTLGILSSSTLLSEKMGDNHNFVVYPHKKLPSDLPHSQAWQPGGEWNLLNPNCGSAPAIDGYQGPHVGSLTDADERTVLD